MSLDPEGAGQKEEDAVLAALLAFHRRRQQRAHAAEPRAAYSRILRHFDARGQRLRGERLVTSELIERLFAGAKALPAPVHRELTIAGPPGGVAAGRVRVKNRSAGRALFELVVGETVEGRAPVEVTVEPRHAELEAGETCLIRVAASLAGWQGGDSATLSVECRWPGGRDRLWLVVTASSSLGPRR